MLISLSSSSDHCLSEMFNDEEDDEDKDVELLIVKMLSCLQSPHFMI